jgi:hypothetical protein
VAAQDLDVTEKPGGEQPPDGRVPAAGHRADDQGLRCQNTPFNLIRSRQRNWAGKACCSQRALSVDGGLGGVKIYRGPVRLDDHRTTILQPDSPDGVDAAGAEAHVGDRATQPVPGPRIQERTQFNQRHSTVDRPAQRR